MTFSNKKIVQTFVSPHTKNAWAYIDGYGWKKIQDISTDGVTNTFIALNAAKANDRMVSGAFDDSTNLITYVYVN